VSWVFVRVEVTPAEVRWAVLPVLTPFEVTTGEDVVVVAVVALVVVALVVIDATVCEPVVVDAGVTVVADPGLVRAVALLGGGPPPATANRVGHGPLGLTASTRPRHNTAPATGIQTANLLIPRDGSGTAQLRQTEPAQTSSRRPSVRSECRLLATHPVQRLDQRSRVRRAEPRIAVGSTLTPSTPRSMTFGDPVTRTAPSSREMLVRPTQQ
jgi:hypothetical protein